MVFIFNSLFRRPAINLIKNLLQTESLLFLTVCATALFGRSDAMMDRWILPKQYYTILAMSAMVIILGLKTLWGKTVKFDFTSAAIIITALCTSESVYGLCQWTGWATPDIYYRVTGHFDNPAGLTACLCVGIPFVLYLWDKPIISRKLLLVCLSAILTAILLSKSRTGILTAIIIIADFALLLNGFSGKKRLAFIITSAMVLTAVGYFIKKGSADGRVLIWFSSLDMLCDAPLTGHGIGAFRRLYMSYQAEWLDRHPNNGFATLADNAVAPFNEFLNLGICFGATGFVVLISMMIYIRNEYKKAHSREKSVVLSVLICIGIMSMFSYPLTYPMTWIVGLFCIFTLIKDNFLLNKFSRNILSVTAISLSLLISVTVIRQLDAEQRWKRAYIHRDMAEYESLMSELGDNPYFLYNYSVRLFDDGLTDKSLETALKCRDYMANYDFELLLGDIYAQKGEFSMAEKYYLHAASMCPCRFVPLNQLYDLYTAHGFDNKAKEVARKVTGMPIKVKSRTVAQIRYKMKKALGMV